MNSPRDTLESPPRIDRRQRARRPAAVLRRLVIILVAGYLFWCGALFILQDSLIFPADMAPTPLKRIPYGKSTVVTEFPLEDGGAVMSWYVPARVANSRPGPVAIFFHGNAEIIDFEDEIVQPYLGLGVSVLLPEYRGYGRAGGKPSEAAIVADCVRFYDELLKRPDVDPKRIVFHGRSLGGAVAVQVAAQRKPAALILQSTFTSLARMAQGYGAPSFLVRHGFRTDERIGSLGVPVLLAHGRRDDIVPFRHAEQLKALVPDAELIAFDCDHNGFPGDGNDDAYWDGITAFLRTAKVLP